MLIEQRSSVISVKLSKSPSKGRLNKRLLSFNAYQKEEKA